MPDTTRYFDEQVRRKGLYLTIELCRAVLAREKAGTARMICR
jgi:hypothetical protein